MSASADDERADAVAEAVPWWRVRTSSWRCQKR